MDKDNNMSQEFVETKESKKYIVIVSILYFFVIVLSVLLIIGIKHQKDVVKNSTSKTKIYTTSEKNIDDKITSNKESISEIYDYLEE